MKGIDISVFNQFVNYHQLKDDGIEFAIIRCGYGKNETQKDTLFERHYKGLKEAGIKVGCYLYSYATSVTSAELEALNCLRFIKGKQFDLPVFYDVEDVNTIGQLTKANITKCIKKFCDIIEEAGYKAGVYANLNWFTNFIKVNDLLKYKIWLAQWEVTKPTANFRIDYWQYTSSGVLNSVNGRVDLDMCFDTIESENKKTNEDKKEIENKKTNEEIMNEVIKGLWGNGEERKQRLTNAGYNYNVIQKLVNENLSEKNARYYVIQKGDTLTSIARDFNTTIEKLVLLNNIKNKNLIYAGTKIRVR